MCSADVLPLNQRCAGCVTLGLLEVSDGAAAKLIASAPWNKHPVVRGCMQRPMTGPDDRGCSLDIIRRPIRFGPLFSIASRVAASCSRLKLPRVRAIHKSLTLRPCNDFGTPIRPSPQRQDSLMGVCNGE
jgi:hypothetical protein